MNPSYPRLSTLPCEVYALLWVNEVREAFIRGLLAREVDVPEHRIVRGMHLTVYYARRHLPNLVPMAREIEVKLNTAETRFMVLAPGGENPRPELEPAKRSVGIRLTRRNDAIPQIQALRAEFFGRETGSILGGRKPSTARRSAFGARHFQPHIKLLKPSSGIDRDLTVPGKKFRSTCGEIEFDRYEIRATCHCNRTRH